MNTRRAGLTAAGIALAVATLVGCQSMPQQEHKDSAPTTTLNPMGGNSYAPQVKAPAAPTALPGNVNTG